ncbi:Mo-dependent nitrogenase C-terminal domain-containing protein [Sphaerospermopsis aphanizomenoides BCCUSP55]|uniref:Mo-dependent nitrogenase C-terminal domain-containing protein n=1 Tax=Sphaerospermopsis aphanizomenoides TaxID=459663 RepID=UPI000AF3DAB7|nr:Mo-dependent nitrogenase C-terminal domain-containing protein [Sphaerospermopsis aphanizomenoides]MBK1987764.1 Mo-dependent nitrogenase C-terminal domain-containing protein [Sphaerospermopsis aphanizomenoides BCCUSP55]
MVTTNTQTIILPALISPIGANHQQGNKFDLLQPIRQWLDAIEIHNRKLAKLIAKLIPAQCPFERDIVLFGHKIAHIPPMCKLNPLYDQLVGLRFRALCYLVDQCGEDIQSYC